MQKKRINLIIMMAGVYLVLGALPLLAQSYTVQKGDSLFLIGQKFGLSSKAIKETNDLKRDTVYPGQKIIINQNEFYEVKKGDTLIGIAQKTGTSYKKLMEMNGLKTTTIYPGEKLRILAQKADINNNKMNTGDKYVLGFYVDKENQHPSSYNTMMANKKEISAIAPFWYRLSPKNGASLQEHHSEANFTTQQVKSIINKAHQEDIKVLMLIHNLLYNGKVDSKKLANEMLASFNTRKAFIDNVEGVLKKYNYDGINMDVENIYLSDRNNFSALIKEMYQRFAPQGYILTVSVPAKTEDNRSNTWSGPFDYSAIGKYSHYVSLMTYDEHGYSSAGPGPIASQDWVENVVKYSLQKIPGEKILVGIAGYGFDWKVGQKAPRYISYTEALQIAKANNVAVRWDSKGKVPYFKYTEKNGQDHEVWFGNGSSFSHKLELVQDYNLGGIAVWRLGLEDPSMWKVVRDNIKVKK